MAIESKGYAGTIMPGKDWAELQWFLGGRYGVYHQDAVKVSPLPSGTRQVRISTGHFGAWGIHDNNTTPFDLTLPTVATGTRWFLIVARRTWQTTNATTFVAIDCGTSPTFPAARKIIPGDQDDQPLAFVPLTAGQTVPGTPRDVRALGTHPEDIVIVDELALQYLAFVGTRVRLYRTEWSRVISPAGQPVWVKSGPDIRVPLTAAGAYGSSQSGWTTGAQNGVPDQWLDQRLLTNGNDFELSFAIRRIGASLAVANSSIADQVMFKLTNPDHWPDFPVEAACSYITTGGRNVKGLVVVRENGEIAFTAGDGNWPILQMASSWTVRAQFKWTKASAT